MALGLQGGMFLFRKTTAMRHFFAVWRKEWKRFRQYDQGALLRALYQCPLRIWLLGRPWNGGIDKSIIWHRYGTARPIRP